MGNVFSLTVTEEFKRWLAEQDTLTKSAIQIRLVRISAEGVFGFFRFFDGIIELKWRSGLRVYTARLSKFEIIVLFGGNKNGQDRDIKKTKKILKKVKARDFNSL